MWLVTKFRNAHKVMLAARQALDLLYQQTNPHDPEHHFYSEDFLNNQWELEKAAQASKKEAEQKQRLELGRLLCLEDELLELW